MPAEALQALYDASWDKPLVTIDKATYQSLMRQAMRAIDPHATLPTCSTPKG